MHDILRSCSCPAHSKARTNCRVSDLRAISAVRIRVRVLRQSDATSQLSADAQLGRAWHTLTQGLIQTARDPAGQPPPAR